MHVLQEPTTPRERCWFQQINSNNNTHQWQQQQQSNIYMKWRRRRREREKTEAYMCDSLTAITILMQQKANYFVRLVLLLRFLLLFVSLCFCFMFRVRTLFFIYCDYVFFFSLFVNIPFVCAWIWSFTNEFMHNINQYGCLFIYVHHTPMHYINIVTENNRIADLKIGQSVNRWYKSTMKNTNHYRNTQIITETYKSSQKRLTHQKTYKLPTKNDGEFFLFQKMLRFGIFCMRSVVL